MPEETNKDTSDVKSKDSVEYAKELADSQAFYDETIPYLEKVAKYETLKATISEQRLKKLVIEKQTVEFMAQSELINNSKKPQNPSN